MKINTLMLVAVVSLAGLAACSRNQPPADNVAPASAPQTAVDAAAPAADAAATAPKDVVFTVDPADVYACEGRDRTVSVVKWDVKRPGVNSVKVLVSDTTDPEKKTLAAMAPVGEATTGNWVTAGVTIELVDGETGAELASHTVTALPCN
jgi:ABC-type Fe3+-hydroxamate transport system substrate-binding protein